MSISRRLPIIFTETPTQIKKHGKQLQRSALKLLIIAVINTRSLSTTGRVQHGHTRTRGHAHTRTRTHTRKHARAHAHTTRQYL